MGHFEKLIAAALAAAALAACGGGDAPGDAAAPPAPGPETVEPVVPVDAVSAEIEQGRTIAETNCVQCHSLDPAAAYVEGEPPPMRDVLLRYDAEVLAEDLIDGIRLGHQDMPAFDFSVTGADALVAFLKSIRPAPGDGGEAVEGADTGE